MHDLSAKLSALDCELCGEIFQNMENIKKHKNECTERPFEQQKSKECRYFRQGRCIKGNSCLYKHTRKAENRSFDTRCRYGANCRNFLSGHCKFTHPQRNPQQSMNNAQRGIRYCRYGASCRFLPNCIFFQYEQDFPMLMRRGNPPIRFQNQRNPWPRQ